MELNSLKARVQRIGRFLSGMVMPNIGAFLAWGFITALFIPTGWTPNEGLAKLVGPIITYLLPLLIGYTGGRAVGGQRGAVVGAIATMGMIVGGSIPMFMGAMIAGPLGGYLIKKIDEFLADKIPSGFEMLINNFSAGILGMILALLNLVAIGPVINVASLALGNAVGAVVNAGLLPLASLMIEPAKILFLNNAINHGVLTPLGAQQAAAAGKSIFFMLESNPGPGLGVLCAYWVFSKGMAKESAPGAVIIHFLGGIHEIYFPYILMNPILLLAVIAGGMTGVFTFSILGAGLVAAPSPGSIFAYILMTPKGGFLPIMSGVFLSAAVSFAVASVLIRRSKEFSGKELDDAKTTVKDMKNASKGISASSIKKIAFACDAGMGSSAMGATKLKKILTSHGLDIEVVHCSVDVIDPDIQLIVCQKNLVERVKMASPSAMVFGISNFLDVHEYDEIVKQLK